MQRNVKTTVFYFSILFTIVLGPSVFAQDIYVSSSKGSDVNNGLTQESPMKTIGAALKKGSTIKLAAGDIFYEYVILKNQTLTRYGEGPNPEINGLRTLVGSNWKAVEPNVWKIDLTKASSTGFVVSGTSELNNIGCLYEIDKDVLHGRKFFSLSELKEDWDFFQTDLKTYLSDGSKSFNMLYLYYCGDPNNLNLSLSVGSHYGIVLNDSSVQSVNVKGFGTGGMTLYGSSNVNNCRVDLIGGSMMLGGSVSTCLGNGIDFWISRDAYDCIIEGNYISRCFDCGSSIQGSGYKGATPRNIVFRDNLISNCCQGWEDFLQNGKDVMFENCRFENNLVVFSGESGFGYSDNRFKYCNVLGNNYDGNRGMILRNNVFIGGNFYCSGPFRNKYQSNVWGENIHYVARGAFILGEYHGWKDVIRIPMKGSYVEAIAKYKELTSDSSTTFRVRTNGRIKRISKRHVRKYLNNHKY